MKLLWLTDVHLNFLPEGGAGAFGEYVREDHQDAQAAVVTGDIGEYPNWAALIEEFAEGLDLPVWFVLGNHDAYGGSVAGMKAAAARLSGRARWLQSNGPVELAPGALLVGHDGWYDARFGDASRSDVVMSDFVYVKELLVARGRGGGGAGPALIERCQELGDAAAKEAKSSIWDALGKGCSKLLFATHVPPFAQATWHEGRPSNQDWLPWMSCRAMGEELRSAAQGHPGVEFTVLCGHTHSPGTFQAEPNMKVLTGKSDYGRPQVSGVLEY